MAIGGNFDGRDYSGRTDYSDHVGCTFKGANFRNATLAGSYVGCNFTDADFTGAKVSRDAYIQDCIPANVLDSLPRVR